MPNPSSLKWASESKQKKKNIYGILRGRFTVHFCMEYLFNLYHIKVKTLQWNWLFGRHKRYHKLQTNVCPSSKICPNEFDFDRIRFVGIFGLNFEVFLFSIFSITLNCYWIDNQNFTFPQNPLYFNKIVPNCKYLKRIGRQIKGNFDSGITDHSWKLTFDRRH